MKDETVFNADRNLYLGIFLSENLRKYDSVRQEQGILQRLTNTMLKKAFSGMSMAVRGSVVAADTLTEALLRESTMCPELFVHSRDRQATQMRLDSYGLPQERKQQIRITSVDDVVTKRVPTPRLKGWFNPLPATTTTSTYEGIELSQAVRQSCDGPVYPVTILTHGLSYHHLLYDYYLRILLEGTYECDSIICTSRASRDAVRKIIAHVEEGFKELFGVRVRYQGRVDLIPLCVEIARFATHDKARARALLKLPKDCFLILMFGRLSPLKADLYPFLPVIKSLSERNPNRQLLWVVAGTEDEGYTHQLQKHAHSLNIDKQLKFMLEVSDAHKVLLMQAADVFTSPTDCVTESFGITVIEAMASGVPQVVPDWDGYRDTVRHGETGFLVSTRWMNCSDDLSQTGPICGLIFDQFSIGQSVAVDMREMENYIHLLMNNERLLHEMAEQSRKRAATYYSFRTVAKQYDELWHELGKIAGSIATRPEVAKFARSRYFNFFGHYASATLSDETLLEITPAGREIVRAETILPPPPAFLFELQILDEEILRRALEFLRDKHSSQLELDTVENKLPRLQIRSLVESLERKCTLSPAHLRRHVMWLIKYGFVQTLDRQEELSRPEIANPL